MTVAEIAREADVSEKTVFNYFPTKEDLFYSRLEAFEDELLSAIRDRRAGTVGRSPPSGTSCSAARDARAQGDPAPMARRPGSSTTLTRVITESPALLARERQVFARYTDTLAALIADETGASADDVRPRAAAGALLASTRR